jgi:uncharacterized protein YbdZ (MbtH family)
VSQQAAKRTHLAFPQDWENVTQEERKAACLAMADQLISDLRPPDEPQGETRSAAEKAK